MERFEAEFTTLMKDLWTLNKTISNPAMRRDIGRILTQNVPKLATSDNPSATAATKDLSDSGFHPLIPLSADELAETKATLSSCKLYDAEATFDLSLKDRVEFDLESRPADVFLAGYKFGDLIKCKHLVKRAVDPTVVVAIANHIGCTPTISAFQMWYTFPGKKEVAAESFHRDRDCFNFVKMFAYLTDVDETSGPHQYIQYSANPNSLHGVLTSKGIQADVGAFFNGSSRDLKLPDLERLFGDKIKTVTASAGAVFLEQTYGLHRGTRPTTGSRLVFSVTYTGLPLRFANDNDRAHEMNRQYSFAEAGIENPSELERYLFRFFLK